MPAADSNAQSLARVSEAPRRESHSPQRAVTLFALCPFCASRPFSSLPSRSLTPSCSATDQLNADIMTTTGAGRIQLRPLFLALAICVLLFCANVHASVGDRLPEFRQCVEVRDHPYRDCEAIQPWKRVGADRTVRRSARRRTATRISRRLRSVRHAPGSPFGILLGATITPPPDQDTRAG